MFKSINGAFAGKWAESVPCHFTLPRVKQRAENWFSCFESLSTNGMSPTISEFHPFALSPVEG
jgi:hypothetical protein